MFANMVVIVFTVHDECAASSIMKSINLDVEPCDNFYEFACGKWQQNHQEQSEVPTNWFVERSKNITKEITSDYYNSINNNNMNVTYNNMFRTILL